MKNFYMSIVTVLLSMNIFAQAPNWQWGQSPTGAYYSNQGVSVVSDANGNTYMTGRFGSPTISFGSFLLTNSITDGSTSDMFIAKYDPSGNPVWVKSAGKNCMPASICLDGQGNIIIIGYGDTIHFGNYTIPQSAIMSNLFIAKFDNNGNVLWAKSPSGGAGLTQGSRITGVAVDNNGDFYISGKFLFNPITFGSFTLNSTNGTNNNMFLVKYDPQGNVIWAKTNNGNTYFTGGYNLVGNSLTLDDKGNLILVGVFSGTITVGSQTLTGGGAIVIKYDKLGNIIWAKKIGSCCGGNGEVNPETYSIGSDTNGNSYITGSYNNYSITIGSSLLTNLSNNPVTISPTLGNHDIFIAKYDSLGNVVWAKRAGGQGDDLGGVIYVDEFGNSFISGRFESATLTFGSNTLIKTGTDKYDIFLAKYDVNGNPQWAKSLSCSGTSTNPYGLVNIPDDITGKGGNIYLSGTYTSSNLAFGSITVSNVGTSNVFIAKLENTVGIYDISDKQMNLTIYPNPTSGQFTIELQTDKAEISITDPLGQQVLKRQIVERTTNLQIDNSGVYIVHITTKEGTATRKLIVNF